MYEQKIERKLHLLVDNPICPESRVTDRFCSLPTNNTTPYSTPWNNCVPPSCGQDLTPSPNCRCAYPFTGLFSFKAPSFSSLTNATIYNSLHDLLMTFFKNAGLPVDSVGLKNPSRNLDDYLVIRLEVFPSGEPSFNRTGIIGVAFALSNQTFKPSKTDFNTYTFMAENYNNFLPGLSGPGGAKHKSSNTGIIIGSAVGGCVLVVLLVLAGMYALRQRGRAERATQQSQPFDQFQSYLWGGLKLRSWGEVKVNPSLVEITPCRDLFIHDATHENIHLRGKEFIPSDGLRG
nr:probable leucine-rich repeat receptor-like protein kinase At5g49770 [Tanacetum cinerariifolium]